jgi:hypothetical protein
VSEHNAWRELLGGEEQQLLSTIEQEVFLDVPPASGWMGWGQKKLENLADKVPNSVQQALTTAVSSALETIQHGSDWLIAPDQVTSRISRRVGKVRYLSDCFHLPRTQLDGLAAESTKATLTGLTLEGGAAGLAGLVGLAADIPILYGALFRLIQEVSMIYGFPTTGPNEKLHMRTVLELGHHMQHPQRSQIVERLVQLQSRLRMDYLESQSNAETGGQSARPIQNPGEALSSPSTAVNQQAMLRNLRLARELAMELLERKLFQGFVVVGSLIGASSNYKLAKDVGQAAQRVYQRRHLMELALRRCSGLSSARITRKLC